MWFRMNKDKCIVIACLVVAVIFVIGGSATIYYKLNHKKPLVVSIQPLEHMDIQSPTPTFSEYYGTPTFEEFTGSSDVGVIFEEEYKAVTTDTTFEQVSTKATGANKLLYDIADSNFIVYYGSQRLSPVFPLALANVETPGRADHSLTWSALFPSKIVSVDMIETMDVTTVVSNPNYFKALSAEVSTRDRGALQMSPTYGTGIASINALMSGTEKDKLKAVNTSAYSGWAGGASNSPGDRFCVKDVCLRLSGSMQQGIGFMVKNGYTPKSDMQLVVMCAMHHHSSGVWYYKDRNKSVGQWKSVQKAYEWSEVVSSQEMISTLSTYAKENPTVMFIDGNVAKNLYQKVSSVPMSNYANRELVCTYPIKALYAYIKLCMLYTS